MSNKNLRYILQRELWNLIDSESEVIKLKLSIQLKIMESSSIVGLGPLQVSYPYFAAFNYRFSAPFIGDFNV